MAITMTSREFNQHASRALALSQQEPVFITKWGKVVSVIESYENHLQKKVDPSLAEVFANLPAYDEISDEDWADFERTLTDIRKNSRHREVDFGE